MASTAVHFQFEDPVDTKNWQQTNEKESFIRKCAAWIFWAQLFGYLLSILGWILCVIAKVAEQWRIWHVEDVPDIPSGVVWIGIWRVCYMYGTESEDIFFRCEEFTGAFKTLPKEIIWAQDLMLLVTVVGAVAIGFLTFAFCNVFKFVTDITFLRTIFYLGGGLNLVTAVMILIPVSWNLYSVLVQEGIVFPRFLRLPVYPKDQDIGVSIYIGYIAALSFLLGALFIFCNIKNWKMNELNVPKLEDEPITPGVTYEHSETCASLKLSMQNESTQPTIEELSSVCVLDVGTSCTNSIQVHATEYSHSPPIIIVTPCK